MTCSRHGDFKIEMHLHLNDLFATVFMANEAKVFQFNIMSDFLFNKTLGPYYEAVTIAKKNVSRPLKKKINKIIKHFMNSQCAACGGSFVSHKKEY